MLQDLYLRNFRLYEDAVFHFHPRANVITGDNASGKTTALEAIHAIGSGRSFRTKLAQQLVRRGSEGWLIRGRLRVSGSLIDVTVNQKGNDRNITVGGERGSRTADLARQLPLLVISPDSHFEFHESARVRRSVLDWFLFHVELDYHSIWTRYQRALVQRNAALKDIRQSSALHSWDEELAALGDALQSKREAAVNELESEFRATATSLFREDLGFSLRLNAGWSSERGLAQSLFKDRMRDSARGFTHSGPHRNDLEIHVTGKCIQDHASHGQTKLLLVALRMAQIQRLYEQTGRACSILFDDMPAELDSTRRQELTHFLSQTPHQVFITATDSALIDMTCWSTFHRFHVKHGCPEQIA